MLTIECRKLAMAIALAAAGMMAACSGSSSTDDALTHPGDNYMGTIRFDVSPSAGTVDITPIASPWSTTEMSGTGIGEIPNVTITSTNVNWTGGDTMDFDVTILWSDPNNELNNVRIGVSSSTDLDVNLTNSDKCAGPWSGCIPVPDDPAITWVADDPAEGPETSTVCPPGIIPPNPACTEPDVVALHAGCGAITA